MPVAFADVNRILAIALGGVIGSLGRYAIARLFDESGVLGGFTTFSALAMETGLLLDSGRVVVAAGYVVVTMAAGLAAVRVGQLAVESRR